MHRRLIGVLVMTGLLGCAGLANDINKGAGTTERELTGQPRSSPPDGPDGGATGTDSGVPFLSPDASGDLHI